MLRNSKTVSGAGAGAGAKPGGITARKSLRVKHGEALASHCGETRKGENIG